MDAEFDYDLTPDQWEALKAIRVPVANGRGLKRSFKTSSRLDLPK